MRSAAIKMTQQHRLKTPALPHDDDIDVDRQAPRLFSTMRIAFGLIKIEQHKTFSRHGPCLLQILKSPRRHLDPGQRIPSTWSHLLYDKVYRQIGFTEQILYKTRIADLGCAFTTNIDRSSQRYMCRATDHPSSGTPP